MIKINEESILKLFVKNHNDEYKTKADIISNIIFINGKPKRISYNYFYINQKDNKICIRLYTTADDKSNYIDIPEGKNISVYVKDLALHIDYPRNGNLYTVFGIDVNIDDKMPYFFTIEQSDDYGLVFTEKDLKELEMFEGIFVNNTRILFSELHWIYIEKDSRHYCTVLTLSDIDCDLGDVTIDLTDKSHINIYIDSESNIHIDIK